MRNNKLQLLELKFQVVLFITRDEMPRHALFLILKEFQLFFVALTRLNRVLFEKIYYLCIT